MNISIKNYPKIKIIFLASLYIGKLRACAGRFRKKKEIIKEWIELQKTNINCIQNIYMLVNDLALPHQTITVFFNGLNQIEQHSKDVNSKLNEVVNNKKKRLLFGESICEICRSFEAYRQYLKSYASKRLSLKALNDKASKLNKKQSNIKKQRYQTLEDNLQKLVFRSFQISLLIAKYIKFLAKNSQDRLFFEKGLIQLNSINKNYDQLLYQEQKQKQIRRIQAFLGQYINANLIYSQQCGWYKGNIKLHIFDDIIVGESISKPLYLKLDRYCSIFIKQINQARIVCLTSKDETIHFLFDYSRQADKFLRIVKNIILTFRISKSYSISQINSLYRPFLYANVVDYRTVSDLKGDKEQQFIIVFSIIAEQQLLVDQDQQTMLMNTTIRQSELNWNDIDQSSQIGEINEIISLSLAQLQNVYDICIAQYGVNDNLPVLSTFADQISLKSKTILQWQCYLNKILRLKNIINNPILLLKKLKITEVILEIVESTTNVMVDNERRYHCKICSSVSVTNMEKYYNLRVKFIKSKYNKQKTQNCYYIFHIIRQEIERIPISTLNNCQELINWKNIKNGQIDYCFRKNILTNKERFIYIYLQSLDFTHHQVVINQYTLVSEVIDQICLFLKVPIMTGYRLSVHYEGNQHLLRLNQIILPIVEKYNVHYEHKYGSSFFSKIKSLGRILQFSDKGDFFLRKIIHYPDIRQGSLRTLKMHNLAYQFKLEMLIGLSKPSKLQLITLFTIKEFMEKGKIIPQQLKLKDYEKYTPTDLEEEIQEYNDSIIQYLQQIREKTHEEIQQSIIRIIEDESVLFQKFTQQMKVVESSEELVIERQLTDVLLGIGWVGLVIMSLKGRILKTIKWTECLVELHQSGVKFSFNGEWIVLKGRQSYQVKEICREYIWLNHHFNLIS